LIQVLTEQSADDGMPEQMLTETLALVRKHPWWQARARMALAVLRANGIHPPKTIMDVGCGWGVNLDALEASGYKAVGMDISRNILQMIDRPTRHLLQVDLRKPVPGFQAKADALLLLDVIEHVDDDRQVTQHCGELLRPGGLGIVSVPARPDLFSAFDEIQGHRRRYLPDRLRAAFANTGLQVRQIFWWGQWMVPLLRRRNKSSSADKAASARTYADYLRLPPWPGPLVMRLLYLWEQPRAIRGKLQTGTSLFAVVAK